MTEKQRSLVIAVMILLGWIALGSLIYTYLFDPHLDYIDSMYFVIVTVTSVGFGGQCWSLCRCIDRLLTRR